MKGDSINKEEYEGSFSKFDTKKFKKLSKKKQIEFMRGWFGARYEDPAQHTPYDSGEGGYIWIYGGPYDADDVLRDNFEGLAKKNAIEELVDELHDECWNWTRTQSYNDHLFPREEDDYFYEFDGLLGDYEILIRLESSLGSIEGLVKQAASLKPPEKSFSEMMAFSFCITFLESYLSDVFAFIVLKDVAAQKSYLKSDPELSRMKFSLGELFEKYEKRDELIKKRLSETSFHNLPLVKGLFHSVLGIDLGEIKELKAFVDKRHDFIHRGGKDLNGKLVKTSSAEIAALMERIKSFCSNANSLLEAKKLIKPCPF